MQAGYLLMGLGALLALWITATVWQSERVRRQLPQAGSRRLPELGFLASLLLGLGLGLIQGAPAGLSLAALGLLVTYWFQIRD